MSAFIIFLFPSKKREYPKINPFTAAKNTHTQQDWFVPKRIALEGLTNNQALWKGNGDNHSIMELVFHLSFWNERVLIAFKGDPS